MTKYAHTQAELVTAWLVPYEGVQDNPHRVYEGLIIKNASEQLIYDLVAEIVAVQGAFRSTAVGDTEERNIEFGTLVGNVPPGEKRTRINTGGAGMSLRFAVEISFKDAAGRYWLRHGNGDLEQVHRHPLELYGLDQPVRWE